MGNLAESIGIPALAGPYLLTVCVFIIAGLFISMMLRPDPLLVARAAQAEATGIAEPKSRRNVPLREAFTYIRSIPAASLGLTSMAIGQSVMVAVMAMTPVHLKHGGADLRIIGFVISGHITGMYIASPLVGWSVDPVRPADRSSFWVGDFAQRVHDRRYGQRARIAPAGNRFISPRAGLVVHADRRLDPAHRIDSRRRRASMQGAADLLMGISGATAGLTAGLIVGLGSFAMLNVVTVLLVVPLIVLAVRAGYQTAPASA